MATKGKRTCLECGFLTIDGTELSKPTRKRLSWNGPRIPDAGRTGCFLSLWESDDWGWSSLPAETLDDELSADRSTCKEFLQYVPGLDPSAHLARRDELWRAGLQTDRGAPKGDVVEPSPTSTASVNRGRRPSADIEKRRAIVNAHMAKPSDFKNPMKVSELFSDLDKQNVPLPSPNGSRQRTGKYDDLKGDMKRRVFASLRKDLYRDKTK